VDHGGSQDPKGSVEGPGSVRVSCVEPRIIGGVGVMASRRQEAEESELKVGVTGLNDVGWRIL
jgi:hypothetical protein